MGDLPSVEQRIRKHPPFTPAPPEDRRSHRFVDFVERRTAHEVWLFALVMILGLGALDILTGPTLRWSVFYLLPVIALAWALGSRAAWIACAASGVVWLVADVLTRRDPLTWIHLWNAATRLSFFVICSALIVAFRRSHELNQTAARTDPVTRVANGWWFGTQLDRLLRHAREEGIPLSFAYIDVDNFKEINDQFGHTSGNRVLRFIAETLRRNIREEDIVARLGGDEFGVALLGETEDARLPLERAREAIRSETHSTKPASVSIGLATFLKAPASVDELIRAADDLMYEVKAEGRDGLKHRVLDDEPFRTP